MPLHPMKTNQQNQEVMPTFKLTSKEAWVLASPKNTISKRKKNMSFLRKSASRWSKNKTKTFRQKWTASFQSGSNSEI